MTASMVLVAILNFCSTNENIRMLYISENPEVSIVKACQHDFNPCARNKTELGVYKCFKAKIDARVKIITKSVIKMEPRQEVSEEQNDQ